MKWAHTHVIVLNTPTRVFDDCVTMVQSGLHTNSNSNDFSNTVFERVGRAVEGSQMWKSTPAHVERNIDVFNKYAPTIKQKLAILKDMRGDAFLRSKSFS